MLNRPLNAVLVRLAIVAVALAALLLIAPAATAQEADADPPCATNDDGVVECGYDENGTDAVADFSAMDPEGEGIDWAVEGDRRQADFDITGGVLTFKKSPNFEMPGDAERTGVEDKPMTPMPRTTLMSQPVAGDQQRLRSSR